MVSGDRRIALVLAIAGLGGLLYGIDFGTIASVFLPWVNRWGWYSMFFFFAVNGVLYFLTALFIPETKGKTLDELETLFEKKST